MITVLTIWVRTQFDRPHMWSKQDQAFDFAVVEAKTFSFELEFATTLRFAPRREELPNERESLSKVMINKIVIFTNKVKDI